MDHLLKKLQSHSAQIIFIVFFGIVLSLGLEEIPYGLFSDEATIGVTTYELIHGRFDRFLNPFLYHHNQNLLGTLPIYTTAPFVALLGLSDFSVRLPGVFFGIVCATIFMKILARLHMRGTLISTSFFLLSPIMLHTTRIAWGMTQSMSLVLLGIYVFIQEKQSKKRFFLVGLLIGLSSYGYLSYIISAPIIISCLILSKFIEDWKSRKTWLISGILLLGYCVALLPIVYAVLFQPDFLLRLKEKNGDKALISWERVAIVIENYPKYYTPHFIFYKGEVGLPGSFITRHNILGHGLLLISSIPILIFGLFKLLFSKKKQTAIFISLGLLFFVFPLPDLITTTLDVAPYSFAVSPMLILYAIFMTAYGIHHIIQLGVWGKYLTMAIIICVCLESALLLRSYLSYPVNSSDFWGWQWGSRPLMAYLLEHQSEYDELILTHEFNAPDVFLTFYDPEKTCVNCKLGDFTHYSEDKKQLFALRTSMLKQPEHAELVSRFIVLESFYLPNGHKEFVIGEIRKPSINE